MRAIEWGRWPLFLSQAVAPLMFLVLPWQNVVFLVFMSNLIWAYFRYSFVNVPLASLGAFFVKLRWAICPTVAVYFVLHHDFVRAVLGGLWPFIMVSVVHFLRFVPLLHYIVDLFVPLTDLAVLQTMFMAAIGYAPLEKLTETPTPQSPIGYEFSNPAQAHIPSGAPKSQRKKRTRKKAEGTG
jgi:hypothetical protein